MRWPTRNESGGTEFSVCGCELRRVRRRVVMTLMGIRMPFSTTNARARFARVPTIAFALSLFAVLLAPLSAFAAAPKISGTPTTAVATGTYYYFKPAASDADGDTLTFSIQNKPSWLAFSTTTGKLSNTATKASVGTYSNIVIKVSDGALTAALPAFSIKVSASGTTNKPPVISGTPTTAVTAGTYYYFKPVASDPEGKTLAFSITNKPSWLAFSTTTGKLSNTATKASVGTYSNIVIKVSDGALTAALPAFSIKVSASGTTNKPPVISGTPTTAVTAGTYYYFKPVASDPEGKTLAFSITNKPSWLAFSTTTGKLSNTATKAS